MHALGVYLGILRSDVCVSQKKKRKKERSVIWRVPKKTTRLLVLKMRKVKELFRVPLQKQC